MTTNELSTESQKESLERELQTQNGISQILSRGFVFSVVWLGGLGSLLALIAGVRALRLIKEADGRPAGTGMAWWCVIVGAIGVIAGPAVLLWKALDRP